MNRGGSILFLQEFSLLRKGGGVSILKRVMQYAGKYGYDVQSAFDRSTNQGLDRSESKESSFFTLPRNFRFGLGRIAGFLTATGLDFFAIISLIKLIKRSGVTTIHLTAHDVCYPVMALAARWCRKPVVVSVHDLWHITVRAYVPENLAHRIFKSSLKGVDTVFVISENMAGYLTEKYGQKNYRVIHDGIDLEQPASFVSKKSPEVPSFLYVGVLHPMQREMFSTFTRALAKFDQTVFQIGICSNSKFELETPYKNIQLTNYGWVDETALRQISSAFSYGLLPLSFQPADHLFYQTSLMTKIPFYIKAGLPILCIGPEDSSAVQTIRDLSVGVCVTADSDGKLHAFLDDFVSNHRVKYPAYTRSLQKAATTTFNMDLIAERFYSNLPAANTVADAGR